MFELARVIWRPMHVFERFSRDGILWQLLATVLVVDFLLSLLMLPTISAAVTKAAQSQPGIGPELKPVMIAFTLGAIAVSSIISSAFIAMLLFLATRVFGGGGTYRDIFGVLLLSLGPLLLGRLISMVAQYILPFGNDATSILSIGSMLPQRFEVFNSISLFDVWRLGLVAVGYSVISGLKRLPSVLIALVVWISMLALLLRIGETLVEMR